MYKLCFFVPQSPDESILSTVKNALFEAGAGQIGDYKNCCWQTLGVGEFMPLANSLPFIGTQNETQQVPEWYVHVVVADEHIQAVITALKNAHPYETPAYQVVKLERF